MSLLRMSRREMTKKRTVTRMIQMRLYKKSGEIEERVSDRVMITSWVRGRNTTARTCTVGGRTVNGKNVPEKRNMGVMKRNDG
jgi:hypothetical protein